MPSADSPSTSAAPPGADGPSALSVESPATVGQLARPVPAVDPGTNCEQVAETFAADSSLYVIPVVRSDGTPVGLLNRFTFLERLSQRFGRALTAAKPVQHVMEASPLVLDQSTPIDQVGELFIASDNRYVFDGLIVTREGRYLAVATGFDLMRAQTERRHAELLHLAQHDVLTGLPNRHEFDRRLKEALEEAASSGSRTALLFIDLDRFKRINDTLGHRVGDLVLCVLGQRLRGNVRRSDTVARLSGDEFAVILQGVSDVVTADIVASEILKACSPPMKIEDQEIVVSCSIGVATFPDDAATPEGLVQAADAAAYHAKQVRNTHQRYSHDMSHDLEWPSITVSALRRAIDHELLDVHYQPKVDLRTNRICGVEALVRCDPAIQGNATTEELIRLAEDYGLIGAISEQVIRIGMRDVLAWSHETGRDDLRLAINISSVQLRQDGLVAMLNALIGETGFNRSRLELEFTESTAMLAGRSASATLRVLKEMGFHLAIDDFGTGYSSLSQLERMPVDALKIDKSFVADIDQPGRHRTIAKAIIALGHSLGLELVAEGVETETQLRFLRQENCDIAQGYLFGRPVSADRMRAVLKESLTPSTGSGTPFGARAHD